MEIWAGGFGWNLASEALGVKRDQQSPANNANATALEAKRGRKMNLSIKLYRNLFKTSRFVYDL